MTEENRKPKAGPFLTGLGVLIFVSVIVAGYFGRTIPFFGENLFLPILMIFVGRAMSRRSRSQTATSPQPAPPSQRRPPTRAAPPPPPRSLTKRPETVEPLGTGGEVIVPVPVPKPPVAPPSAPPAPARASTPRKPDPVHYPVKMDEGVAKPKSSAEMVADAKERLKKKR